ncbi:MAG: PspC domain-containing protein [Salinivirgaceae bacterium]|nr:PspC domain-containing protein [Salinivirgaceae bacterium]
MKKTVKINISGIIFHLDEDAFNVLQAYLNKLKVHFSAETEGNEIVNDIETRIAELLQLKITEQKQVISIDDVHEIIEILGKPEDFLDDDHTDTSTERNSRNEKTGRKFYRDLDSNVLGGVCAGLGAHFNIDPVILRVLFIVFAFPLVGFTILLYLVLWIVIPAAITTAQKVDMRGGNYSISDIEHAVKNEFENVKGNFNKFKSSNTYNKTRSSVNQAGSGLVEIIAFFGRIIIALIGIAFIIAGISMIASFAGLFVFSDSFLFWTNPGNHHAFIPDFMFSLVNPKSIVLASVCLVIFIGAPIIAIIYWGLKLVLRFKANDKAISLIASVAWILSILILLGITLFEAKEYAFSNKIEENVELNLALTQTIYLKTNKHMDDFSEAYFFEEGLEVYTNDEFPNRIYFSPKVKIKYTSDNDISIKFEKEARGATNKMAKQNAKQINYSWNLHDSILYIDPFFYQNSQKRWNFPELDVVIYLPENQKICVDKNLEQSLHYVRTAHDIWIEEIPGKCWIMTEDGLDDFND